MFDKLVVVFLTTLIGTSSGILVTAVTTAVSVINEITSLVTGMDGLINLIKNDKSEEVFQQSVLKKLNDIHEVCTKIDGLKGDIGSLNAVMKENTEKIVTSIEFSTAKRIVGDFKKNIDYVNKVYNDKFSAIWNKMQNYRPGSVQNYIQGVVGDSAFDRSLSELFSDITSSPFSQSSIFSAMSKYYDTQNGYKFRCENISPLDDLHIFYGNVILTFARGYAVLLMSYQYLKMSSDDFQFYQDRQNTAFENFKGAIEAITQHAKIDFDSITNSDYRASYSCDSKEWKEGTSFIRVKNYISVQLSQNYWEDHVNDPIAVAKSKEYDCSSGWAEYRGVPGAEADTKTQACTTPFSPNLTKPYSLEYQEFDDKWGRIWESRRCITGSNDYFYRLCELDWHSDRHLSIRKLSLRLQECDTSRNEVLTDARFHEQDNMIHIKLRCGVLRDRKIDPKSLRWTEDNERFSESNPREYVVLSSKLKSFNIDNVVVPDGELVTGAGFKVVDDHFISLVVKGSKVYNYNKGTTFGEGKLYSTPNSGKPRRNIDISLLERPPKIMNQTYDMSKVGETYINLTISKWSNEYHNEAIVPYFDMTPYTVNRWDESVAPLGGLGLFYKSLPGHTGFLAFKHLSPTYVQFVDTNAVTQSTLQLAQEPLRNWTFQKRL